MPSPQAEKVTRLLMEHRRPAEPISPGAIRRGLASTAFPVADDIDVEVVDDARGSREVLRAPGAAADRVLLYVHGGGFAMGSPATHRKLAAELGRASGRTVVVPDYPLAPEHPFPAGLDAVVATFEALAAGGASSVVLAGDSAGAGLVLSLLGIARDRGLPRADRALLISPWFDLARLDPTPEELAVVDPIITPYDLAMLASWYLDGADPLDPLVSPGLTDPVGLPPILVHIGGSEVLLPDVQAFESRARAVGADVAVETWPGMFHVWHTFSGRVPEATEAVERAGSWLC